MDIPCIAAAVPGQAVALPGSTRATAPRNSPKIVPGTVPCPQPGPPRSPSLWSGLIPKEILSQQPGFPRGEGALLVMPGRMPTVWRCRLGLGTGHLGTACSSHTGALGELWGADLLPGDHPHPWIQLFSQALHCTPARGAEGLFPCLLHAPGSRGEALLGTRTS